MVTLLGPGLMKQRISNFKSEARARVHMPRVKSENHTLATATVSVRAQKCSPLESLWSQTFSSVKLSICVYVWFWNSPFFLFITPVRLHKWQVVTNMDACMLTQFHFLCTNLTLYKTLFTHNSSFTELLDRSFFLHHNLLTYTSHILHVDQLHCLLHGHRNFPNSQSLEGKKNTHNQVKSQSPLLFQCFLINLFARVVMQVIDMYHHRIEWSWFLKGSIQVIDYGIFQNFNVVKNTHKLWN